MRKRQREELNKPVGRYDLIAYVVMDKGPYGLNNKLIPLGQLFSQAPLSDPEYDINDLVPSYVKNIGMVGGKKGYLPGPSSLLIGLPFGAETSILGYRKDLLKKHNINVPSNYDQLVKAMCEINAKEPDVYGLASRGSKGHQIVHAWLLHLAPMGGKIFDDKWNPIFNNAAGVKALNTLRKISECGHPNMKNFGASESNAAFLQGETAFYLDTTNLASSTNNPKTSYIIGKTGWALHPKDIRRGSQSGGFGIGIPTNSQKPEAAFLLLQWLTSKRIDKEIVLAGGGASRVSSLLDYEVNQKLPYMAQFEIALRFSDPDWRPLIPEWDKINAPILGQGLAEAVYENKDPKKALDDMAKQVREVMDSAGYYNFTK